MKKESPDDRLIQWMNGDLNEEERQAFLKSEDYKKYEDIFNEVDDWQVQPLNVQDSYSALKSKIQKPKVISWYQSNIFRIAAVITIFALAVSYFVINQGSRTIETGIAETKVFYFPDSTRIILGPLTRVEFEEEDWINNRWVTISGKGYFDVVKGSPFRVGFDGNLVEVLGTTFEITNYNSYNEVVCFSGKVRVSMGQAISNLTAGAGVRQISETNSQEFTTSGTPWSNSKVQFTKAPLSIVIQSLESQFNLTIDYSQIEIDRTFTGAFTTEDTESALKMVFGPMNISYEKNGKTVTLH